MFLIIDLLLFAKLLELLAIDHSSSERRIIFVPRWLKFSHVLVILNLHGCALLHNRLDNAIRFSTLCRMSTFLWNSSKWACCFGHFLQYTSGLEVLACSLNTDLNYGITILQLRPFPEPLSKVVATFRAKIATFWAYS